MLVPPFPPCRAPHRRAAGGFVAGLAVTALAAACLLQVAAPARASEGRPDAAAGMALTSAPAATDPAAAAAAEWLARDPLSLDPEPVDPVTGLPSLLSNSRFVGEWDHVVAVVSWLRYRRPGKRVVYLFGGSASRESVNSESAWSRQLSVFAGRSVTAYVVSSKCQTFVEDARIARALPPRRGLAVINVGLSRFLTAHKPASVPHDSVSRVPPGAWYQHHYDQRYPLSYSQKAQLVEDWVRDRSDVFADRYMKKLEDLESLIVACRQHGLRPVLIEMPINRAVIRHAFAEDVATYREGCEGLADAYNIKYLRFAFSMSLGAAEFYDLWHLLPSGRAKWQARLSRELLRAHLIPQ